MVRMKKPEWLKVKMQGSAIHRSVDRLIDDLKLNTVCDEAKCPNRMECFEKRTATFMILGDVCTRNCAFCSVTTGRPQPPDPDEPKRVAEAVRRLGLRYAVITSVDRDDLPDGGASQFAQVITEIKAVSTDIAVEVLIPDFRGDVIALETVFEAASDVINHNIETVNALFSTICPQSDYATSIEVLRRAKEWGFTTKSGLMVGLGETWEQVVETLKDLRKVSCDRVTIGQYLQPNATNIEVVDYITPEVFEAYEQIAKDLGFESVQSGPFVRSSYHAEEAGRPL